jgi:predicted CoA-binding protein
MTALKDVQHFLGLKRIAVAGVSRERNDFTRTLWSEFLKRGYDAVPVNPAAANIEGTPCFHSVQEIEPPVEGVLVLTSAAATGAVVADCAQAGVKDVWLFRLKGEESAKRDVMSFCKAAGMRVISDECPLMFLPETGAVHRFHGFCNKLFGLYPR